MPYWLGVSLQHLLFLSFLLVFAGAARADSTLCDKAARVAAAKHSVPFVLMQAIARVESGRSQNGKISPWPWTVHYAGRGHWFSTRAEAENFVPDTPDARQRNIDIGCFQINLRWHGHNFQSVHDMFSPHNNADYAAQFLKAHYDATGSWTTAMRHYHSKTVHLADRYQTRVDQMLQRLETAQSDEAALRSSNPGKPPFIDFAPRKPL
jgi:hypothetical protein